MKLTEKNIRDIARREARNSVTRSGGYGGGGVSEAWVEDNYISKEYHARLFNAYNGTTLVNPNDAETSITSLEIMISKLVMPNNSKLMWKNSSGANKSMLTLDGYNNLILGEEQIASGQNTYVRGYTVHLQSGNTYQNALSIAATGLVEIVKNTVGLKIGGAYLVWDETNNALKLTGANGATVNFVATGGITALD